MKELTERTEVLFSKREKIALERLAEKEGTSMGHVVRAAIRCRAQRKKVWK